MSSNDTPPSTDATTTPSEPQTPGALSNESLDQVSGGLFNLDVDFSKVIYQGSTGGGSASSYTGGSIFPQTSGGSMIAHESTAVVQSAPKP
jgi:hypothetical protein